METYIDENQIEEEYQPYSRPQRLIWQKARRSFENTFEETFGEEIDVQAIADEVNAVEDLEDIANTEANEPDFPMFTFIVALTVDVLGFADFTGVGWFIMCIVEIIFTIVLFFLMFGKLNTLFTAGSKSAFKYRKRGGRRSFGTQSAMNKMVKKFLGKYISRRLAAILIVKIIPFIGILGSSAFFVVLAHNKQKKIVRQYMLVIERVGGILKDYYRRR
jgi:hypothetical protein